MKESEQELRLEPWRFTQGQGPQERRSGDGERHGHSSELPFIYHNSMTLTQSLVLYYGRENWVPPVLGGKQKRSNLWGRGLLDWKVFVFMR